MSEEGRWRVVIAAPAARDLERLPIKVAGAALEAIRSVAEDPYRRGKRLHFELQGLWSARRGPYRVIYATDDERKTLTVTVVAHRADVYGAPAHRGHHRRRGGR